MFIYFHSARFAHIMNLTIALFKPPKKETINHPKRKQNRKLSLFTHPIFNTTTPLHVVTLFIYVA